MNISKAISLKHRISALVLHAAAALLLVAPASRSAHATTATVGPHGTYATIQAGVTQVMTHGGGDVLVEVKFCHSPLGYDYVCPYVENIVAGVGAGELNLRGGWHADFASQYTDGTLTQVKGTGSNNPVMLLTAAGATIRVTGFDIDGTGVAGASQTLGIAAFSGGQSLIVVLGNRIHDHSLLTAGGSYYGGAAIHAVANGANGTVTIDANSIFDNVVYGTNNSPSYGGAVTIETAGGGQAYFDLNDVHANSVSNPNNGGCHGGALWVQASTGFVQLDSNSYAGNSQFACSNGATGDAAEVNALNAAEVDIRSERWTSNSVANDPGVYEVFLTAASDAAIYAGNGLVTHGTWGGLYAQSDASDAHIIISNFTIADNPVLGYRGVGAGTQLWNTILWNDGTPYELDNGATFAYYLFAFDPLFVDAASGNYRLSKGSPAINTGTNAPPGGAYTKDLDGITRPYTGDGLALTDIGAYEFHDDTVFSNGFEQQL